MEQEIIDKRIKDLETLGVYKGISTRWCNDFFDNKEEKGIVVISKFKLERLTDEEWNNEVKDIVHQCKKKWISSKLSPLNVTFSFTTWKYWAKNETYYNINISKTYNELLDLSREEFDNILLEFESEIIKVKEIEKADLEKEQRLKDEEEIQKKIQIENEKLDAQKFETYIEMINSIPTPDFKSSKFINKLKEFQNNYKNNN